MLACKECPLPWSESTLSESKAAATINNSKNCRRVPLYIYLVCRETFQMNARFKSNPHDVYIAEKV